ncbi:tetratricopeptide repeat protein 28-like isoform X1 [Orbicella faveolata]|uniref:tetratricopeptide repeat protein 28-like isoform X1 n=1 Tax=Orbicella faveolata TaxID=48498 RepID=UPI0009E432B8|nr:tetratricopeptide repeat protein 28-like isoform X1 [Orbicella faveolata]
MYNVDEVIQVISIGLIVASFLLHTNRFLKAIELCKECLFILKDTAGLKGKEINKSFYKRLYFTMRKACSIINDNTSAIRYAEKILEIYRESGERLEECVLSVALAGMYLHQSKYAQAKQIYEKALLISKQIGYRKAEACCYRDLANMYRLVGEYEKAREHLEKSLAINKETGDIAGEASCYTNLGNVYGSVGEYEKAREHLEKSLAINKEIGDIAGEATCYTNLGTVYGSVGEYDKASDYLEKSSAMSRKIGTRHQLAISYHNLATQFWNFRNYRKANEYNKKALAILTDIGDKSGVASVYITQGLVEYAVGAHIKGKEYFEEALAISKEIGNRSLEAQGCFQLGQFFFVQAQYAKAEEYIKKGLTLSEEIGDIKCQFDLLQMMASLRMRDGKIQEAILYFFSAIEKCEEIRGSLRDNDQFKISFSDCNILSYRQLSSLLSATGNPEEALYVSELSRARALADLMSARYSVENKISANPRRCAAIEGIVAKQCNRTCLYVSYSCDSIYLWILKGSGATHVQLKKASDLIACEGLSQRLKKFFNFRGLGVLPEELCEDGSLHDFQPVSKSCEENSHEGWRSVNESKDNQGPKMNLPICYKLIIAPVADLLEGPEIIIVPDRALHSIPFAALTDESGKYLSETFRIRVVPSLTTLQLINEIPADYHCQTGALIVGNPDVGQVHFKGRLTDISRLPCAENEARMVGEKLGVEPLLGQQATKHAVLQAMNSAALIHIAAHGDAERGAIALAPSFRVPNGIPQEGLYLLTMSDISKIQLRAKLVVLSCSHSARGLTKAEGVVGIARAFLGSGARSVLVALWALHDKSTEQLMGQFYDHLVAGESAGESLHEAMKWMRNEGYDVNQWAPFILIGDDVTFDFGTKGKTRSKHEPFLFLAKGLWY